MENGPLVVSANVPDNGDPEAGGLGRMDSTSSSRTGHWFTLGPQTAARPREKMQVLSLAITAVLRMPPCVVPTSSRTAVPHGAFGKLPGRGSFQEFSDQRRS
jgi:hypothetical protein